jgi:hypothetical protein
MPTDARGAPSDTRGVDRSLLVGLCGLLGAGVGVLFPWLLRAMFPLGAVACLLFAGLLFRSRWRARPAWLFLAVVSLFGAFWSFVGNHADRKISTDLVPSIRAECGNGGCPDTISDINPSHVTVTLANLAGLVRYSKSDSSDTQFSLVYGEGRCWASISTQDCTGPD